MAITTRETTATGVTNKGSPLTNAEVDTNFVELKQGKLANTVEDTSPQLGGDLDLNSNNITGTGGVNITGNIALSGTVDGRDVAADGTKLDGIESNATADQTNAEIRAAVEAASDSNVFTDADHTKLNGIETSATADQTAAEIRALVESATDSNVFTDADHTKLNGIEASADVTDAANVTTAGALMDSEVTNLAQVKAFSASDYATAAQGAKADSALQNVVEDTSPQLGGNLDFNGNLATTFTSTGIDDNATGTRITVTDGTTEFNSTNHQLKFNGSADDTYIGTSSSNNGYSYIINYAPSSGTGNNGIALYDSGAVEMWSSAGNVITGDLRIDASGNTTVKGFTSTGIDDNATSTKLTVSDTSITTGSIDQLIVAHSTDGGGIRIDSTNDTNVGSLRFGDVSDNYIGALEYSHTNNAMSMYVNNATRMTIDSSGRMIIGNTSSVSVSGGDRQFQVQGTNGVTSSGTFYRSQASTGAPSINLAKDRGSLTTAVISGDSIGAVNFVGSDGTDLSNIGATISATISGSVSNNVLPTDLIFSTNGGSSSTSERMRIDSSGNVGIGTNNPDTNLHISESDAPSLRLERNDTTIGNGNGIGRIQFEHQETGYAGVCATLLVEAGNNNGNGEFVFQNGVAGTVTEKMRIDRNGNVGIGTDTPQSPLQLNKTPPTAFGSPFLSIGHDTYTGSGMYTIAFGYEAAGGSNAPAEIGMVTTSDSSFTKGDLVFATRDVVTDTAPTERMRIDNNGNLLVGKTTSGYTVIGAEIQDSGDVMIKSAGAPLVLNRDTAGPNATIQAFYLEDTLAGIIAVTKSGTPAFAASSDERLKESITDHESELSHVMSLRPVRWDWKDSSKGAGEGFVAQELEQTAWSDLVSDGEDGYKMVSGLGAVETRLIKALQEAVTRIETLEAEVAALKGE